MDHIAESIMTDIVIECSYHDCWSFTPVKWQIGILLQIWGIRPNRMTEQTLNNQLLNKDYIAYFYTHMHEMPYFYFRSEI